MFGFAMASNIICLPTSQWRGDLLSARYCRHICHRALFRRICPDVDVLQHI
jgi:hypothetical protein